MRIIFKRMIPRNDASTSISKVMLLYKSIQPFERKFRIFYESSTTYLDTFVKYVLRTSKYGQGKKCLSQMDYRLNKGDDAKNGKQRDFTTYHNDSPFLFFKILHLESLKNL